VPPAADSSIEEIRAMSALWDTSAVSAGEYSQAQPARQRLAEIIIVAAVVYNFVLCFVNTSMFEVSTNEIISIEVALVGLSFGLTYDRSIIQYAMILLLAAYLVLVMVLRGDFDAQFARDILIPIVFFYVGKYLGTTRRADRLVAIIAVAALAVSLFEWFALDTYLHYFDVIHYYIARGTVTGVDTDVGPGLYVSGTRTDARTLLPFLGDHRASGLFLEPVSVGNFGAIAFAWVLLRDRGRLLAFLIKIIIIATLLVLADARFGFYLCFATLAAYAVAPWLRPTMLFVAPFVAILALVAYAGLSTQDVNAIANDLSGRLLFSGTFLRSLSPWNVFGLQTNELPTTDAGYVYMLVNMGVLGTSAIWALFCYAPVPDRDAWRFKIFVALYIVVLMAISTSLFTIKTAALLWYLYGTLNNPNRALDEAAADG
jgi:putative polymerase